MQNCANNTGANNLYTILVKESEGSLHCLPSGCVGGMMMFTAKTGKPDLGKVMPIVIEVDHES